MSKEVRKRYCFAQTCPNFSGTLDQNIRFFRAHDRELRSKWELSINGTNTGAPFRLCQLHFREDDFVNTSRGLNLKEGTLPIPTIIPKEEISEDILTGDVKVMDVEEIKRASDQQKFCVSCINYDVQIQAAHIQIAELKKKLSELREKNTDIINQIQCISNGPEFSETCSLCNVKLTASMLKQHLCIDQESIRCSLCTHSRKFRSTVSFVKHLDQHRDAIQAIDKSALHKCNICCNIAYPMEILLECHKKSHGDMVEQPEKMDVSIESNDMITIDEVTSNDYPNLSDDFITVVIEIDESSNDESEEQTMKLFKCGICDQLFDLAEKLACHMRENHPTYKKVQCEELKCFICRKNFTSPDQLRIHLLAHTGYVAKDQKCEVCQAELTLVELNSHLCGDKTTISCEYCSNAFTSTLKLLKHLEKSHEKRKLYRCEKCPKFFSMNFLKECHMKTHANDKPKTFACKICPKTFALEQYLQLHIKTHESTKSHLCEECGKSFISERNLESHKMSRIHHSEPTLQCPDCPRKFYRDSNLQRHREMHRDLNYVCEICNAELKSSSSWRKHIQIHKRKETDRRYQCTVCPLKFFTAYGLRTHQRAHNGEKVFNCQFCDVSYKYSGDLNKHLKTHLGDKIYECKKCTKKFKYPLELQKHEFMHYKEEKEANGTNQ